MNNINIINLLINNIVTVDNSTTDDNFTNYNIIKSDNILISNTTLTNEKSTISNENSTVTIINPIIKLNELHSKLKINYGNFREEYPEQEMSILYIKPNNIVLELGGNIGRNSCIIASILNDSNSLLVIESDPENAIKLKENRDLNNLNFNIVDAAISKTELLQKDWITKSKDLISINDLPLWKPIKTISWLEIQTKYNVIFDTLVADCEGALYYILKEEPNFLDNFKTIIIENDFTDIEHKKFVDEEFKRFNLKNVYTKTGGFGPCYNIFFEVWTR